MPKRLRVSVIDPGILSRALALPLRGSSDFDLNPESRPPADRVLRPAGVLIAVRTGPSGADLILTKRSSRLKHHPGQIAFPGGKVEPGDGGPVGAALRESREEVGLPQDRVTVLGTLPQHETVTGFLVTPVLGIVSGEFTPLPEAGEVEEVFTVPLAHVTTPANFRIERRRWQDEWRRYHAVPYGPYYIWGATARILRGLADRLSSCR
ncbi:MAG: CoA pyrophosphatase [Rhodobacter sp.]|nr:CoA pyrophosphatase [Rhodobacter sp.]MCA3493035.1 CoA pyrophosphatase [Rhodobacter sp.]MCA3500491.1 CoA pyrophosphatase [Rhodobacter sp.]MCA3503421.1 CoA pyrophosphatase [Rhodobacter sp.]MCA3516025.1 CoA pyrophosphatase [Rhodobacter sp.]